MAQKSFLRRNMDLIIAFIVIYIGLMGFLYLFQRNFMYFPSETRPTAAELRVDEPEIVDISHGDMSITGWYWPPKSDNGTVVVYFHGNGATLSGGIAKINVYREAGYGVLWAEYRGYAGNGGAPSEGALISDAKRYMNWLIQDKNIEPDRMVLFGESLGTGIAVQMATQYPVRAVILESAYTSTVDVAQQTYWMFPVKSLMKDQYRSIDHIKNVKAPILFIHAESDQVIPVKIGREIYEATNAPKKFIPIKGASHNNLYEYGALNHAIKFIQDLEVSDIKGQP